MQDSFLALSWKQEKLFILITYLQMKLVVFLKNKKELFTSDWKYFLTQRYKGCKNIILKSGKVKLSIPRTEIKDFIQRRYYNLFKQLLSNQMQYSN